MPLALLTRPLHACVLVLAALLAVTAYAGPAQDFAAADNAAPHHPPAPCARTPARHPPASPDAPGHPPPPVC